MVKKLKAPRPASAAARAAQRAQKQPPEQPGPFTIQLPPMSPDVVNLLLEALGNMPMARVEHVVNVIRAETQQQLQAYQQAQKKTATPPAPPAPTPAPAPATNPPAADKK